MDKIIKRELHDGALYLITEYRGSIYTLSRSSESWFVSTQRKALGRNNIGGGKLFSSLNDVAQACKAFGSETTLQSLVFGITEA